ncbi:S8 family peptidase [Pontibacter vulgaris]|uniref:S8 family peptidase n=1 Tax=Pontibacter vulgaris TaxID=2905679 RepID=UPI001FA70963|nr:S8 family serine peptidase [Pontibacter vulgaris]
MKKPKLGKQIFLSENNERLHSFEKHMLESGNGYSSDKPLYTGRYFMIYTNGLEGAARTESLLESAAGLKVASITDFSPREFTEDKVEDADVLLYPQFGIALVSAEEGQIQMLEARSHGRDYILEPEKIVYVPDDIPSALNVPTTWGISAIRANSSPFTGRDVKIAVLDTGFDLDHPDFKDREIISESFVPNESVNDKHGHGTHCIGTACGNINYNGIRYGVARNSIIYAGKVLSNRGSGAQAWILNGMNWAISEGCRVISMSLGSAVFPGQGYDPAYERAASFALSKGTVVVAAAGNESRRSHGVVNPIGSPANCPSVLAVGALDRYLNVADFSCKSINPGQMVDIAAPGVDVYSSWPMPTRYRSISGTSMATPHVAGILGLLFEQYPAESPQFVVSQLLEMAQPLEQDFRDVGRGLAISPSKVYHEAESSYYNQEQVFRPTSRNRVHAY